MDELAVYIRGAVKHYGRGARSVRILQDLNMNVPTGSIYGLLGASGCGKTTLLSCIVGCLKLNSGEIRVLGGRPGEKGSGIPGPRIGYMPQDIALVGEFTVREAIYYFGWLFDMRDADIEDRFDFLCKLLDLPDDSRYIKSLSGGQQRRVSFAVALINNPELLILDEPTVGLDPVLRQNIWDYLQEITAGKTITVIITTHYIEEAREAHTIGLLRGGRLLVEDSPQKLLRLYKCNALESVFLTLSMQQSAAKQDEPLPDIRDNNDLLMTTRAVTELPQVEIPPVRIQQQEPSYTHVSNNAAGGKHESHRVFNDVFKSLSRMRALLVKNFTAIYRNPGGMLFILMFPVLEIIVFFIAIGHDPRDLTLAIVNQELGNMTDCTEYERFHNVGILYSDDECYFSGISCLILDHLSDSLALKEYYRDEVSAVAAVQSGHAVGVILFPTNFSQGLQQRMQDGRFATDVEEGEMHVHLDMADRQIGLHMQTKLFDLYLSVAEYVAVSCNQSIKMVHVPILFNEPVYGIKDPRYVSMVAPGVIISMIYFLATTLTSTVIITDQFEGVWNRNLVAGVTSAEILFSHILCQLTCVLVQCIEVIVLSLFVFDMVCHGHLGTLLFLVFLQGVCGMCFGLVISVISENLTMANYMSLGSFFPFLTISGVLWPIEGMPTVLRWLSLALPGTLPTLSMRYILEKGWALLEPQVLYGFLMTIGWIIGQCVFCLLVLRIRNS